MGSLLDSIKNSISPDMIRSVASSAGESPDGVRKHRDRCGNHARNFGKQGRRYWLPESDHVSYQQLRHPNVRCGCRSRRRCYRCRK